MTQQNIWSTGSIPITDKGRVLLPAYVRQQLHVEIGDRLDFKIQDGQLILWPDKMPRCKECHNVIPPGPITEKLGVCESCLTKIMISEYKGR